MKRLATVCALAGALVVGVPGVAGAHPANIPGTIPAGVQTSLTVAVPSEPPAGATAMTGIDIALPAGLTALTAQAGSTFPSVNVVNGGHLVQARGGSVPGVSTGFITLQVDAATAGSYPVVVTAIHDDGSTTVWDGAPGTDRYSPPLVVTGKTSTGTGISTSTLVGGAVLVGAAALAGGYELTRRRRRAGSRRA